MSFIQYYFFLTEIFILRSLSSNRTAFDTLNDTFNAFNENTTKNYFKVFFTNGLKNEKRMGC